MLVLALAACGPSPSSTAVATLPATMTPGPSAAPPGTGTAIPSSATGFAFDAESVAGYYETRGYACTAPQPSSLATGYQFTSCQLLDANGRTRVVGVVTDPNDDLADGFTSIRGTASETVLDPSVALDPFAAFLGAMLGPTRGEALLTWLAEHIGDSFAETTSGDLHVATYIKGEDHSTIYVEIANQAYLEAPAPSPS
ncbi:MAG: hypothetical protein HY263_03735 [Chloroflexi bacterium]|nr:hypothetical protein [Chloroflexota bacterium]